MSLLVDNHPLARDLPELKEQIHALKISNTRFHKLMEQYEALDKLIVRVEQGLELRSDDELDALKMRRVEKKDELYAMLTQHKPQ